MPLGSRGDPGSAMDVEAGGGASVVVAVVTTSFVGDGAAAGGVAAGVEGDGEHPADADSRRRQARTVVARAFIIGRVSGSSGVVDLNVGSVPKERTPPCLR